MAHIQMRNVQKRFGNVEVIPGADLEIGDNEFVVFVGPSGCGKSTLLRLLAGLEDLSGGAIEIDGERIDHLPPSRRGLAMVFQSYALYPHMTVRENMSYALKVARTPKAEIETKVRTAAEILQLTEYLDRRPKALSGGQRQRVAIGRAIVRDPKVFLFDEPLSNLDAKLRVQMRIEITRLHRRLKATMIFVTHDQIEAMTMADRIVVLNEGRIEQIGAPLDLYNHPANRFVAGFIGSPAMNFFDATVTVRGADGLGLTLADGAHLVYPSADPGAVREGDRVTLGIRPEAFHFDPAEGTPAIAGEALAVERLGGETYLYLQSSAGTEVVVHAVGDREVVMGERIAVGFDPRHCHLFDPAGQTIRQEPRA